MSRPRLPLPCRGSVEDVFARLERSASAWRESLLPADLRARGVTHLVLERGARDSFRLRPVPQSSRGTLEAHGAVHGEAGRSYLQYELRMTPSPRQTAGLAGAVMLIASVLSIAQGRSGLWMALGAIPAALVGYGVGLAEETRRRDAFALGMHEFIATALQAEDATGSS